MKSAQFGNALTYRVLLFLAGAVCALASIEPVYADGGIRTVVLSGEQTPGLEGGVTFTDFRFTNLGGVPALNDNGRAVFPARSNAAINNAGTWVETSQGLALLVRDDTVAPGGGSDIRVAGLQWPYHFNNAGQVGLFTIIKGPGIALGNRHGLFISEPDGGNLVAVARGTDLAPGVGGDAVFLEADGIQLNDGGQAAFSSNYSSTAGNGSGVWRFNIVDGHELVAKSGDAAAGTVGAAFGFIRDVALNGSGQLLFGGSLSGGDATSLKDSGLWLAEASGATTMVLREGAQAPGMADGVTFSYFSVPGLNDAGRIAFQGGLRGPGVTTSNNFGVWSSGLTGSLELLARQGSHAPGTPGGVVFGPSAAGGAVYPLPVLNNAGHTAFFCELTGSGVTSTNNVGLWSNAGGVGLELIMREGSPAPGTDPGVRFAFRLQDEGGQGLVLLDDGRIAFGSRLAGPGVTSANDQGIWAHDQTGDLQLIVRTGQMIDVDDGPGVDLRTINLLDSGLPYVHGFNDRGQLLFQASFTDGTQGLFVSNRVALPTLTADFDRDLSVDAADLTVWTTNFGLATGSAAPNQGDADGDLDVDGADFLIWQRQNCQTLARPLGTSVPEPKDWLVGMLLCSLSAVRRVPNTQRDY